MDIGGRSGDMVVFATVAEQGSLSAAARALGLTPSAVSRIFARTEQRLGTRLLLRTTRAITLTAGAEVRTGIYRTDALKPTGAGDAFNGGFTVALSEGRDVVDAVRFGCATAGISRISQACHCAAAPRPHPTPAAPLAALPLAISGLHQLN